MCALVYQDKQRIEAALGSLKSVYDCGYVRGMLSVYLDLGYFRGQAELYDRYDMIINQFEKSLVFGVMAGLEEKINAMGS